jgi:hypothetical protein
MNNDEDGKPTWDAYLRGYADGLRRSDHLARKLIDGIALAQEQVEKLKDQ